MPLRTPRNLFYLLLISCTVSTVLLMMTLRNIKAPQVYSYGLQWIDQMKTTNSGEYLNISELRNYILTPAVSGNSTVYGMDEDILALIVVTSHVDHCEQRQRYRESISPQSLSKLRMRRVFLLATKTRTYQRQREADIRQEQWRYGDLLQGSFVDSYHNNYKKNIMGLDWASRHWPQAKFIVKMDDDVVHNLHRLYDMLHYYDRTLPQRVDSAELLIGNVRRGSLPIRNRTYKWYVSERLYLPPKYPDYLPGCLYVLNPATAESLVLQLAHVPVFWIDDIWITGILRESLRFPLLKFEPFTEASGAAITRCLREFRLYHMRCPYLYHHCMTRDELQMLGEFQLNGEICHCDGGRLCHERSWFRCVYTMFWDLVNWVRNVKDEPDPMLGGIPNHTYCTAVSRNFNEQF